MPSGDTGRGQALSPLAHELWVLETNAIGSALTQFERSRVWGAAGISLGVLSALAAATAGVGSLSELIGPLPAGIIALLSAVLMAVNAALGAETRSATACAAGNSYIELRDALRQVRLLDAVDGPPATIREQVRELTEKLHAVNKAAPIPGRMAQRYARRRVAVLEKEAAAPPMPAHLGLTDGATRERP